MKSFKIENKILQKLQNKHQLNKVENLLEFKKSVGGDTMQKSEFRANKSKQK